MHDIFVTISKVILPRCCRRRHYTVRFKIGPVVEQTGGPLPTAPAVFPKRGASTMALVLKATQEFTLAVESVTDKKGNPATVDGPMRWGTSDPAKLTFVASPDGMSAVFTAVGPIGDVQASVQADADLGPDEKLVLGTFDVNVVSGEAAVINLNASTPIEQP